MGGAGEKVALNSYLSCCSYLELVVGDEFEAASAAPHRSAGHRLINLSLCIHGVRFS